MKKRILIHGRFTTHHFAVRNVIYNLARELSERENLEVFITINKNSEHEDFKKMRVKILYIHLNSDNSILNVLHTLFIIPIILMINRINICIYPGICFYLFAPCKTILYMHDLIEYHIDNQSKIKLFYRKIVYPYDCKRADKIITVSENSKRDLEAILKINKDKIAVAYNGYDEGLYPVNKNIAAKYVEQNYHIKNYIYFMGYITHPQKNLIYLINEFAKVRKIYNSLTLTFAGPIGKDASIIFDAVKDNNIEDSFKYLGKVPYEDIKYLYSAAKLFCFPSLYEGFGMPVLEAMASKTIVFASNVSSMPEILTNEKYLVDPYKEGDLSEKILRYFQKTDDENEEVLENNYQRAKYFSWKKHADIVYRVISELK
jgi:glycosyltransferase involved in cell wall biosynthesis